MLTFVFYNLYETVIFYVYYLLIGFNFIYISNPFPYFDFMCWGVPMHLKFPFTIIANRVESAYAYYMEWVVRITVHSFFYVEILDITFHINLRAFGSMPVEG